MFLLLRRRVETGATRPPWSRPIAPYPSRMRTAWKIAAC